MDALKKLWARVQQTPAWQAWTRYGSARGNVLAGGVTYFSFLSIFPMLALAFAIFGLVLRGQPQLLDELTASIATALPGFIDNGSNGGLITLGLPEGGTIATTGIVGVVGLLFAGLGWLDSIRQGVRAIFGVEGNPGNAVLTKVRDLGVLALLGLAVLISAGVSGFATGAAGYLADLVGLGGQGWVVTLVGLVVQALLNTVVVALLLRVLSGVHLPWHGLRQGAIIGGVAITLIQTFASLLIAGTKSNPVFGSIAVVVGLLVFLNFIARALLISAAFAANDLADDPTSTAADRGQLAAPSAEVRREPDYQARVDAGLPTFGTRVNDRATLAAGAVLGATLAVGLRLVGNGARSVTKFARRH